MLHVGLAFVLFDVLPENLSISLVEGLEAVEFNEHMAFFIHLFGKDDTLIHIPQSVI